MSVSRHDPQLTDRPIHELTDQPVHELTGRPSDRPPRGVRLRRWLGSVVGIAIVGVAVSWSLVRPGQAAPEVGLKALAPRPVRVAQVDRDTLVRRHRYFAVTRTARRANLALTVGGRLQSRAAEVGALIKKGDVLARVDAKPLRHAVSGARAQLAEIDAALVQARRDVARADTLVEKLAATAEEAEQRRSAVARLIARRSAARVRLAEARRMLREGGLIAPFDGRVTAVNFEVGEWVPPGRPVLALAGDDGVEAEIEVPESVIGAIEVGSRVRVTLPLLDDAQVEGTVQRIGLEASGPGRLFPVVIRLPAQVGPSASARTLVSGMTAVVQMQTHQARTLLLPLGAVLDPAGGDPRVFRVRPSADVDPEQRGLGAPPRLVAETVPVVVGELTGDGRVALRASGDASHQPLKAGDRVVTGGHFALLDTDPIAPVTR